jgi:hypothetical protein
MKKADENDENGYYLETAIREARRWPNGDSIKLQSRGQAQDFIDWLAENGYLGTIEVDALTVGWRKDDPI